MNSAGSGDDAKKPTVVGKTKFVGAFDCPFDLETVFTLQYSTDGLKGVLQWIIEHLGQLKGDMQELDTKVVAKLMQVDK